MGLARLTKVGVTSCVVFCVAQFATVEHSVSTSHSSSNLSMLSQGRWATSFRKSARNKKRSKKQFAAKKNHSTTRSIKESRFSSKRSRSKKRFHSVVR